MDSIQVALDLSRDSINIAVFVIALIAAIRFRPIAISSLRMARRGELWRIPAIDWFLCGIWWMAVIVGTNQLGTVLILRCVHSPIWRRIMFDLNDHLMVGVIVALVVALTSSRRLAEGYDAARRLLLRLLLLAALVYGAAFAGGIVIDPGPHLADQHMKRP